MKAVPRANKVRRWRNGDECGSVGKIKTLASEVGIDLPGTEVGACSLTGD